MHDQPARLDPSLDRGLTPRRLRLALARPLWALRNARFHWIRTISDADHVFVMGPPRSGTTLMQSLLRAHPAFVGLDRETYFFLRRNYLDLDYPELTEKAMQTALSEAVDSVNLFDRVARQVVEHAGARRFIEKTPEHILRLPFLLRRFPQGCFVFVVRDPRDGYLSALRNPTAMKKIKNIPTYAELWKRSVASYCAAERGRSKIIRIRYEQLCADPSVTLGAVMRFLGEKLDERQLDPENYSNTKIKATQGHQRLGEPISDSTVGQWRSRLSTDEIAQFDRRLGKWMKRMRYPLAAENGVNIFL